MAKLGRQNLDALSQNKAALELSAGDTAMEESLILRIGHAPADDKLVVLQIDAKVLGLESGDRQRDFQPVLVDMFDIVGWVRVRFRGSLQQPLNVLESQQKWAVEQGAVHIQSPPFSGFAGPRAGDRYV